MYSETTRELHEILLEAVLKHTVTLYTKTRDAHQVLLNHAHLNHTSPYRHNCVAAIYTSYAHLGHVHGVRDLEPR